MPRPGREAALAELQREAAEVTSRRSPRIAARRVRSQPYRCKQHPLWRVLLREEYEAALACPCQHCGVLVASELHHHRGKRGAHMAPSQIWKAAGARSAVEAQWAAAHGATVAVCAPCHSLLEAYQGRTRARPLPFALEAGKPFHRRVGPCACPRCAE